MNLLQLILSAVGYTALDMIEESPLRGLLMKPLLISVLATACIPMGYAACTPETHQPPGCLGPPLLLGTTYDVIQYFIEDVVTARTYGPWHMNPAQNPGWYPCGTLTPITERVVTYSERREVCWAVSGSVTVEAKTGLAASLLAELGASVTIGTEFTKCKEITESHTWSIGGANCYHTRGREEITTNTVKGHVLEHEAVYTWGCHVAGPTGTEIHSEGRTTYCNTRRGDGDAETFGRGNQIAPRPAACGGYIPAPDIYDGMRSDPVCHPLSECGDTIPPGGHPCCGCYGNP